MIFDAADQKNDLVFLPTQRRTSAGERFDTQDDEWDLSSNGGKRRRFIFSAYREVASNALIESWKSVAAELAANASVAHAAKCSDRFKRLIDFIAGRRDQVSEIDASDVSQYLEDSETKDSQGRLRTFLRMWGDLGLPGVSKDAIDYVEKFSFGSSNKKSYPLIHEKKHRVSEAPEEA